MHGCPPPRSAPPHPCCCRSHLASPLTLPTPHSVLHTAAQEVFLNTHQTLLCSGPSFIPITLGRKCKALFLDHRDVGSLPLLLSPRSPCSHRSSPSKHSPLLASVPFSQTGQARLSPSLAPCLYSPLRCLPSWTNGNGVPSPRWPSTKPTSRISCDKGTWPKQSSCSWFTS